jgi:glycosyltransferase involved in cell wall biosynthesis
MGRWSQRQIRQGKRMHDRESFARFVRKLRLKNSIASAAIIPAYVQNSTEISQLKRAVLSVQNQVDLVLIIDDASPMVIENVEKAHIYKVWENAGPAAARNLGLKICQILRVDHILFLDSDCVADPNWASFMIRRLKQGSMAVGGLTKALGSDHVSLYHDVFGTLNGRLFLHSKDTLLYNPTCNFGITLKCEQFFDEQFPDSAFEDVDFCVKLLKSGHKISFEPLAVMMHDYKPNLLGFCMQFKKYGMSEKILLRNHPDYFSYIVKTLEIPSIDMS